MELRVDGKVALVTGATQGVGHAIATALAEAGAAGLLLTGRDGDRGRAAAAGLGPAAFVGADLADPEAPERLVRACEKRFGRLDILVNAAGLTDRASVEEADLDTWTRLMAVNARAPFFLMQHAIRAMKARGEGGAIVNVLSKNAECGHPSLAVYSGSKGALATLTKNAAHAHRTDRIRVNGILMGWTDTPAERAMQAEELGQGPGWLEAVSAVQPFGRLFVPQEVAALALFLASDAAGPMTGALVDQEQWVTGAPP